MSIYYDPVLTALIASMLKRKCYIGRHAVSVLIK